MRRARYQRGSLSLIKRKDGVRAWKYRWREIQADGTRKRRAIAASVTTQQQALKSRELPARYGILPSSMELGS